MQENRVHRRVTIETEVWRGEDGLFSRGDERLADLSIGGAFMEGAFGSVGGILSLRFKLPGGTEFITVTAIARHTRAGGLGVEFLDLSPDNLGRLRAFVDSNS